MEKSAINTVYVATEEVKYENGYRMKYVCKCFYREDEAKKYVEMKQKESNMLKPSYILWVIWDCEERTIE